MANLFDTKYLQYKTIKVIPNHIFNTIFYVEDAHNGALKQVKLIRVEHNLASGKRFYVVKTPLGEMKAQSLILYSTIDDWQNKNVAYYLEKWGGKYEHPIDDIINKMAKRDICVTQTDMYGPHLMCFKWNGFKPIFTTFQMPNEIVQDVNGFHFTIPYEFDSAIYGNEKDCEQANAIRVIMFDDEEDSNHNQVVKCIGQLGEKCQEMRDILNDLNYLVGSNTLNGKETKIDDDIITQGLLSQWLENIEPIENFCIF